MTTKKTLDVIGVDSPDDVIPIKAPDFYYSVKHLEEERLRLLSEAYGIEKKEREQIDSKSGPMFEMSEKYKGWAAEIERAQQILNHYEIQYLSKAKLKQKMKSTTK